MTECWFNVYSDGRRGFFHETSAGADFVCERRDTVRRLYRIHVRLRDKFNNKLNFQGVPGEYIPYVPDVRTALGTSYD